MSFDRYLLQGSSSQPRPAFERAPPAWRGIVACLVLAQGRVEHLLYALLVHVHVQQAAHQAGLALSAGLRASARARLNAASRSSVAYRDLAMVGLEGR